MRCSLHRADHVPTGGEADACKHVTPRGDGAGCQVVTREIKHQMNLYSTKLVPDLLALAPLLEVHPSPWQPVSGVVLVASAEADGACGQACA
jgi:hypothetical protein